MRDFKGMKRQRGRNRGGGGGGGKPQHNANRAFESNGPDGVKVRGAAQGIFERYQQLARDAASAGDRVLAENYLQHAEHYFRTLRAMQPHRPLAEILGRDQVSSGFDIDFEAEPGEAPPEETTEAAYEGGEGSEGGNGEQQRRDDRQPRERYENRDRNQGDRPREGQQQGERQRDDRPRDDRPRDGQQQGEGRRDFDGNRNNRNRDRDRWRERDDRPRGDQPREQSDATAPAAVVEAPQDGPVLRSQDGEVSHAPAFLGRSTEPREEAGEAAAPRQRRRRAPRPEGSAAPETEEV